MNENANATTNEVVEDKATETATAAAEVNQPAEAQEAKTFTQEELDAAIERRLARAEKKFNKQLEEAKKPTQEQLNSEEQIKTLQETINNQKSMIIGYEAKSLLGSKVNPEMMEAALQLLDLKDIDLDEKGTYKDEINEKIDALLEKNTWLKKADKPVQQGFIKAGTESKPVSTEEQLRAQIRQGLGLKD